MLCFDIKMLLGVAYFFFREIVKSNMPYLIFFFYLLEKRMCLGLGCGQFILEKVKHICEHLFQISLEKIYV